MDVTGVSAIYRYHLCAFQWVSYSMLLTSAAAGRNNGRYGQIKKLLGFRGGFVSVGAITAIAPAGPAGAVTCPS
jgi:hypothetical protein